jgi:hypothetical protein
MSEMTKDMEELVEEEEDEEEGLEEEEQVSATQRTSSRGS